MTPGALHRQRGVLEAVAISDIITDVFSTCTNIRLKIQPYLSPNAYVNNQTVISIPVLLLWKVKISLRRKIVLGFILCLSIFTIITSLIKVIGGYNNQGQIDAAWAVFWLQAEAAVAVVIVSITAFRALFIAHQASKHQSPAKHVSASRAEIWSRINKTRKDLPRTPSPTSTGVRTHVRQSPYDATSGEGAGDIELPMQRPGILVTKDIYLVSGGHCPTTETLVTNKFRWIKMD